MPSNPPGDNALGERIDKALTPHGVLGIARDASSGETRAAYIELAKLFHPDAHPGDPLAERRFMRIQEAYSRLKSPYPMFMAYKARDARSHRRVLCFALTVFVLTPAAVLLATYGLREAPGQKQVKADIETRSDFSPKAQNTSEGGPIPAPLQSERTEGSLDSRDIALAEPRPDADIAPQDPLQSIGITPQAEPASGGRQGQTGPVRPANPAVASGPIAGVPDKDAPAAAAEPPGQAPSTVLSPSAKRLKAKKLAGSTERLAKATIENSIPARSTRSRYGDFSADDVLRSTRVP